MDAMTTWRKALANAMDERDDTSRIVRVLEQEIRRQIVGLRMVNRRG